jgi:hypothetical protein
MAAIAAIAMLAVAAPALTAEAPSKDEVFTLKTAIQVPGKPLISFDISWVDPVLNGGTYFLADRSNKAIDVVNPSNNSITQFINPGYAGVNPGGNDFSGPDGVLTANNHTELWVGDSPGKVWVLNSSTGAIKTLPGGATNPILVGGTTRADELCYDPRNQVIMIASPGESPPFVTFISTTTYLVLGKLKFDGTGGTLKATNGLEQCGWSPKTGKFYQNVPEVNGAGNDSSPGAVAVIDPTTRKIEKSFPVPIADCAGPQGMAIGPSNQILLGCNAKSPSGQFNSVIINANSGAVEAVLRDLGGADEVWFNEGDGHYFLADGSHLPNEQLGVVDAAGHRLDQTIFVGNADGTTRRAHSVAADPNTNQVYLPIPATGGGSPGFTSTLCGATAPLQAQGCIAVFATKHDDHNRFARERGEDDHQE